MAKKFDKEKFSEKMQDAIDRISKDSRISVEEMTEAIVGHGSVAKIKQVGEDFKFLKNPKILDVINKEFDKKIVGEKETRKAIFVCACGAFVKNLNSTFNVLINGESSTGKSWVTKNTLDIFPEKVFSKQTYRTRISPNAFTYWHNSNSEPNWTWDGKVLYLEDIGNNILNCDVFKVMVSEGSTATIVGRKKGKGYELPTTYDIEITGKPITFVTTATSTPIEEIKNRFFLIDLDESKEQTEKIMEMQTIWAKKGEIDKYNQNIKNALSQLERVEIILPDWINNIKNFMPRKELLRWRREFPRFLEIIKCSTALHQYQRKEENGKIIAEKQDYDIAKAVIGKISASSGAEGLTHKEKRAYEYIKEFYKKYEKGCTRQEIYSFKPVYSDRWWASLLDKLSAKGLLSVELEVNPDTKRKASFYYPIELENLSLPSFEKLVKKEKIDDFCSGTDGSNGDGNVINKLPKKTSLSRINNEGVPVTSITSITLLIKKDGKPFNLVLKRGEKYQKNYFGDDADEVIDILEKQGKIKVSTRNQGVKKTKNDKR